MHVHGVGDYNTLDSRTGDVMNAFILRSCVTHVCRNLALICFSVYLGLNTSYLKSAFLELS